MAKNDHFYEDWKVGRSNANPVKLFSIDPYDLNSVSFKFGSDIFFTFEMAGSSYQRPFWKMNISFLFRPSVIRGPWIGL